MNNEKTYNIEITDSEYKAILTALSNFPFNQVAPLVLRLSNQYAEANPDVQQEEAPALKAVKGKK